MQKFEPLIISELASETVLNKAKNLATLGTIHQRENYCYLKVDDNYIHWIHPLVQAYGIINKPDYFDPPKNAGAHISIIYPEENVCLLQREVGQKHSFSLCGLIKAQYGSKAYYALSLTSPSLAALRQNYSLAPKPSFKGQPIVFHITVGVSE